QGGGPRDRWGVGLREDRHGPLHHVPDHAATRTDCWRPDLVPRTEPLGGKRGGRPRPSAAQGATETDSIRLPPEEASRPNEQGPWPRHVDGLPGADVVPESRPPSRLSGRRSDNVSASARTL